MGKRSSKKPVQDLPKVESPTISGPICLTCIHYLMPGGFCRALPPQVVVLTHARTREQTYSTQFPRMEPTGACGVHRPRIVH